VHRNVANLVVNNDNSLQSVFQYAVEYLQVCTHVGALCAEPDHELVLGGSSLLCLCMGACGFMLPVSL
jgi:hypothetical protein